jgi:hypothetical protein
MASTHCPACPSRTDPKFLAGLSTDAYVNYWRCNDCHHIWTTTKDGDKVLRHVTPLPIRTHTGRGHDDT